MGLREPYIYLSINKLFVKNHSNWLSKEKEKRKKCTGWWVGGRGGREWRESKGGRWVRRISKRRRWLLDRRSDSKPNYRLQLLQSISTLEISHSASSSFLSLLCCYCCYPSSQISFFLSVTLLLLHLHLHLHIPSFLEFSSSSSSCFYIWTFWTHSIPNIYIKCCNGSGQIIKLWPTHLCNNIVYFYFYYSAYLIFHSRKKKNKTYLIFSSHFSFSTIKEGRDLNLDVSKFKNIEMFLSH